MDFWSPTLQKKYYSELIGHPSGGPKLLRGAIEFPEDILNSADPETKNAVDKNLGYECRNLGIEQIVRSFLIVHVLIRQFPDRAGGSII